jgi:aspartate aminotransferase-like enzyme
MIPGSTIQDPSVLRAMAHQSESHLSPEWAKRFKSVLHSLKQIFFTNGECFVFAGSGTLSQEAGLTSFVERGDKLLCLNNGYFGARFAEIAKRYGIDTETLRVDWGKPVRPEDVKRALKGKRFKAVTAAHVETSTGVAMPIREIAEVVRESGSLFIVDAIASFGGMEIRTDDWGVDVVCSCSQKCIGVPPGLVLIGAGKRAVEYLQQRESDVSAFYADLKDWLPCMIDPIKYHATPPINLIYALREACRLILEEGLEARFVRHRKLAEAFRQAMVALGLELVPERGFEADTVTATYYPAGVEDLAFRQEVERNGVIIARGFGPLEGKIFRVGHMGQVSSLDLLATIGAIERSFKTLGFDVEFGSGLRAAQKAIM